MRDLRAIRAVLCTAFRPLPPLQRAADIKAVAAQIDRMTEAAAQIGTMSREAAIDDLAEAR